MADCEFRDATSDPAAITDRQERELLRGWLLRIVLSFCVAASEEIRQDRQSLAQAICQRDELFEEAARCAGFDVFRPEVRDELYRSNEWSEGERLLANAAKAGPVEHNSEIDAALPERGVKVNDEMRNKRKEKGWTQEELEAQTRGEVTVSTISRAERGARIDLKSVKKIAAALGVDSAALIDKTQQ